MSEPDSRLFFAFKLDLMLRYGNDINLSPSKKASKKAPQDVTSGDFYYNSFKQIQSKPVHNS